MLQSLTSWLFLIVFASTLYGADDETKKSGLGPCDLLGLKFGELRDRADAAPESFFQDLSRSDINTEQKFQLAVRSAKTNSVEVLNALPGLSLTEEQNFQVVLMAIEGDTAKVLPSLTKVLSRMELTDQHEQVLLLKMIIRGKVSDEYRLKDFATLCKTLNLSDEVKYQLVTNFGNRSTQLKFMSLLEHKDEKLVVAIASEFGNPGENEFALIRSFHLSDSANLQILKHAFDTALLKQTNLTPNQRYELAEAHANGGSIYHMSLILSLLELSPKEEAEIWALSITKTGSNLWSQYSSVKFDFANPHSSIVIRALANSFATYQNNPSWFLGKVAEYKNLSESQRFELGLAIAVLYPNALIEKWSNLSISDPNYRQKIWDAVLHKDPSLAVKALAVIKPSKTSAAVKAMFAAADAGTNVLAALTEFELSRAEKFRILNTLARSHAIASQVGKFGLTKPQLMQLASTLALSSHAIDLASNIHNFKLTRIQRQQVLESVINTSLKEISGNFSDTDAALVDALVLANLPRNALLQLAKQILARRPSTGTLQSLSVRLRLSKSEQIQLEPILFAFAPEAYLRNKGYPVNAVTPIEDATADIDLIRAMRGFSAQQPHFLPAAWTEQLWKPIRRRDAGLALLRLMYQQADYNSANAVSRNSLEIYAKGLGFPVEGLRLGKLSENTIGDLLEVGLDIERQQFEPPFAGVNIDTGVFADSQIKPFIACLSTLRNAMHLRGNHRAAWRSVMTDLKIKESGITAGNLADLTKRAQDMVVQIIKEKFGNAGMSLSFEQLEQIEKRWGNMEPIYTLLARFQGGNAAWQKEITTLGRVFEMILQDKFNAYKFEGFPGDAGDAQAAQAQLAVLATPEAKRAWMTPHTRASVVGAGASTEGAEAGILNNIKSMIQNNLIPHLGIDPEGAAQVAPIMERILNARENPKDTMLGIKQDLYPDLPEAQAFAEILKAVVARMQVDDQVATIGKSAKFLLGTAKLTGLSEQIISDIRSIDRAAGPVAQDNAASIVISTTFVDPKTLLTVGDLVDTTSCQNYRTGSHIETLLGYVIDADVVGFGSFVLKQQSFEGGDYQMVYDAIKANRSVTISFDGDSRRIHFELSFNGVNKTITSKTIPRGYLRHMLKLGRSATGAPGIAIEPAYRQNIPALDATMDEHLTQIVRELRFAIGAQTVAPINIVGSRNLGGVYSDLGRGAKVGGYSVEPGK